MDLVGDVLDDVVGLLTGRRRARRHADDHVGVSGQHMLAGPARLASGHGEPALQGSGLTNGDLTWRLPGAVNDTAVLAQSRQALVCLSCSDAAKRPTAN